MSAKTDQTRLEQETQFESAIVGEGSYLEPDVAVGFRYHPDCGPARVPPACDAPWLPLFHLASIFATISVVYSIIVPFGTPAIRR